MINCEFKCVYACVPARLAIYFLSFMNATKYFTCLHLLITDLITMLLWLSELPTRLYPYGKGFNDVPFFGTDDGSINVQFDVPFNFYGKAITNAFVCLSFNFCLV